MVVENGRGYVPATEHTPQAQEIGIIPVDAAFSPVIRVRYEVEETRVGQKTNYDKLTMEIWTNGSVTPEMALVESAKILRKHLNPFVQYNELGPMVHSETRALGASAIDQATEAKLGMSLAELELSVRATNCLESENITTVRDLVTRTEEQLLEVRNFGETTLAEVREKLADIGLRLGMRLPSAPPARFRTATQSRRRRSHATATPGRITGHTTMRHRRRGRKLGRKPNHQRALLRSLATALFLTERDAEDETTSPRSRAGSSPPSRRPKRCGRWWSGASPSPAAPCRTWRRPTIWSPNADRHSEQWRAWRHSDRWQEWSRAIAPVVAARRRALRLLGDKQAVRILFEDIAPRFADRPGGYTRVLRLAKPRLGDAGTRAILELVGKNDRVAAKAARPSFESEEPAAEPAAPPAPAAEASTEAAEQE